MKLKISTSAYNEIATLLERNGIKASEMGELILEKGTQLSCPIDFKMVTIRRDVASIAAQAYKGEPSEFIDFTKKLYEFILSEEKPDVSFNFAKIEKPKKGEW